MAVRIKGLVSAFNDVRAQLQAGISPEQEKQFGDHIHALIAWVEEICTAHDTTPTSLPSPSRRAYTFLKDLDTRHLPRPDARRTTTTATRLRIANVVRGAGMFSKRMWDDLPMLLQSEGNRDRLASGMLKLVSGIEAICYRHYTTPISLKVPSRRAYCWLKFLLVDDNLRLHLAALDRGRSALAGLNSKPERVEIHIANMNSIWRRSSRGKLVMLKVSEGFLHADEEMWQALIKGAVNKRDGKSRGTVKEYIDSEEFSGVLYEIEAFTETISPSSGHAHNLDESFERVNSAYFSSSIPKPRLRWNHVRSRSDFLK